MIQLNRILKAEKSLCDNKIKILILYTCYYYEIRYIQTIIVRKGDKYIIQLIYIYTYIYKQNLKQYNTRLFNYKIKQNIVIDGNI